MLTQRRVGDHLAQEVEVRRHQRHNTAATEHGQVLLVDQSHLLLKADRSLYSFSTVGFGGVKLDPPTAEPKIRRGPPPAELQLLFNPQRGRFSLHP